MEIKVINKGHQPLPQYATPLSSGMDLRANIEEPIELKPGARALIPTGLHFGLPEDMELQVRPRSGLAIKHGITVLNAPGTVDADFRGEVKVILINQSFESFTINDGDKIAQAVIAKVERPTLTVVNVLDKTERGEHGFMSSGLK